MMRNTKQLLGARIKELRKVPGLSQDKFSERIGVDPKHLSRIELGKSFLYMERLEAIAKALAVELKDISVFQFYVSVKVQNNKRKHNLPFCQCCHISLQRRNAQEDCQGSCTA